MMRGQLWPLIKGFSGVYFYFDFLIIFFFSFLFSLSFSCAWAGQVDLRGADAAPVSQVEPGTGATQSWNPPRGEILIDRSGDIDVGEEEEEKEEGRKKERGIMWDD